jgi:hypothetical protein
MTQVQRFICASGGTFFNPMSDPSAKVNVATVPCKYKVGRVLGQGTYAVVKGDRILALLMDRSRTHRNREILCCQSHQ